MSVSFIIVFQDCANGKLSIELKTFMEFIKSRIRFFLSQSNTDKAIQITIVVVLIALIPLTVFIEEQRTNYLQQASGPIFVGFCGDPNSSNYNKSQCLKNATTCPSPLKKAYINKPGSNQNGACGRGTKTATYVCCTLPGGAKPSPTDTPSPTNAPSPTDTPNPLSPNPVSGEPSIPTFLTITPIVSTTSTLSPAETPSVTPNPSGGVSSPTPTPQTDTLLSLSVILPGIGFSEGGNLHPLHPIRPFTLWIYNLTTHKLIIKHDTLTFDGNFFINPSLNVGNLPSGNYQLFLKTNQSLVTRLSQNNSSTISIQNGQTITVPPATLLSGDIAPQRSQTDYGDNILDINDYNLLLSCYGAKAMSSSCQNKQAADLNDDGIVDAVDYNLLLRGFAVSRQGDTIPPAM